MKIAIILRRMNIKGGTQRLALYLACELTKRGYGVKFYTLFFDGARTYPEFLKYDITFVDFNEFVQRAPIKFLRPLWQFFAENRAARALASKIDPDTDLLNPHDQVAYRVTYYYRKRCNPRIPSVWNMNDPPSLKWGYDRERECEAVPLFPWWKTMLYCVYDWYDGRKFISLQDAIICQDRRNVEWINTYYGHSVARRATTVRNGPDAALFVYHERKPLGRRVRLLTSGILFAHRRYEDAIRAVKILAEWGYDPTLEIIGEYRGNRAYHEKLLRMVRQLGVAERVMFLGEVPEESLVSHYHKNDIFLYQHHWQTDGLSPTEAMACGTAVVVSRTAGAAEIIKDRQTGIVVGPKDPEALAGAVRELIENPSFYLALSRNGMRWVHKNLSPHIQAEGIFAIYQQALLKRKMQP